MSTPSFEVPPPPPATGFVDTWRRVMSDPRGFFADMPQAGGLQEPLAFLAVCAAADAVGTLLVCWRIGAMLGTFVAVVAAAFVAAAALTLVAQHLFDGRAGFEPTFRVVAYAAAPVVFLWLPRLWVIPLLYSWYLQVRGVERVQQFDATRAVLAVAVKSAALLVLAIGLGGWRL
jgi:hypothetical protein